jgi:serine/threonine protein kinase
MEHLDGGNLRAWLARPHDEAEVLAVFLAAGRGLAAVHAAGLVHRDFKPENVLLGSDGRVRIGDFGLAGVSARASAAPPLALGSGEHLPGTPMIERLIGTPGYIAPEQLGGAAVDHRADQYAFCVAMVEALTGQRPMGPGFAAPTVSPRVRAALARGLAASPAARWPSMDALLAELAGGRGVVERLRAWWRAAT